MSPNEVVNSAIKNGCQSISFTYTEPTVFFEYSLDTAIQSKDKGIKNIFVTNGFMSKDAIIKISPYLDDANIDLKFFNDDSYRFFCSGKLKPVLNSIRSMVNEGVWVEITTLIIPGKNDSREELGKIARFISDISCEIPWHISRFHPDYKYTETANLLHESFEMAINIGYDMGLKYVYVGNNINIENAGTFCPECRALLIMRMGFSSKITNNFKNNNCLNCGAKIFGIWA